MKHSVVAFVRDSEGATAIEYAVIASLISVGIIGAVIVLSENVGNLFGSIAGAISG